MYVCLTIIILTAWAIWIAYLYIRGNPGPKQWDKQVQLSHVLFSLNLPNPRRAIGNRFFTMKKLFLSSLLALAALFLPSNAWATAYAVWCSGNKTLYFTERSGTLSKGGTFTPAGSSVNQTITNVWSGSDVTATGTDDPGWKTLSVYNYATTVVFEPSFKSVRPTSTNSWFEAFWELTTIQGLQYLNTDYVTDMSYMFSACYKLTDLDLSNFNTGKVTDMNHMFYNATSLISLDLSSFNVMKVKSMRGMFSYCFGLMDIDLSSFYTENVTDMRAMFSNCSSLASLNLSEFETGQVTDMAHMFSYCSSLSSLDVTGFDTGNVTTMVQMFQCCSGLTELDVSNFDTGKVTGSMAGMFEGCSKLKSLDLSHFNTANVTSMQFMFGGCSSLTNLDISTFNTKNVKGTGYMFRDCPSLSNLDLSSFNTAKVIEMSEMFKNCSALTTIYVGDGWNTDNVTSSDYMFYNCKNLVGGYGAKYKASRYTDKTYAYVGTDGYLTGEETGTHSYNLTVSAATLSTLYLDYPVRIPEDENLMGVYYGKGIGGETLRLARVKNVIPANTGVIVFANPGTYTFERSTYEGTAITDNVLQGSTVKQKVSDIDGTVLTLGQGNTGSFIGFYQYTGTTLAANKAYIVLDKSSNVKALTFSMEDDEATDIRQPEIVESGKQTIYNLSGQRVESPKSGIYIVNGKKVFIK